MTTRHEITDSKGKVHKRTSEGRVYSHAVVIHIPARDNGFGDRVWPAYTRVEWASRLDLAQKTAARYAWASVEIIPATITYKSKPKAQEDAHGAHH